MAIYAARKELVLTTPYFIPSESILAALLSAAGRGVKVTLGTVSPDPLPEGFGFKAPFITSVTPVDVRQNTVLMKADCFSSDLQQIKVQLNVLYRVKADAVVAAIKKRADRPIRYVIDTSADPDHVGGNEPLSKAGETLFNLNSPIATAMTNGGAATILSAEKVLLRMSAPVGQSPAFPTAAWPTETFYQPRRYMYINGEGIEVLHQAAAHTDGDSVVFFRRSDVVMAGDVFDTTRFPMIDVARGGSIQGEIDALNRIVDLAIPSIPFDWRDEGTYVIPGHGRLCDQPDVVEYRDMVVIIRDRVRDLIDKGMTLEQVKAAKPSRDYDTEYLSSDSFVGADRFVESVYTSLRKAAR
jgi:glyoxylase-like metal-dependent hydrolase (beta-lactamase superfamily II)